MATIAVSACLLGTPCRYDGKSKPCATVQEFLEGHEVVPVCPEVLGGLRIPHPPAEIQTSESVLRLLNVQGEDVTAFFEKGAQKALEVAQSKGCTHAILKAKSPSCGVGCIYDGNFSGTLVKGNGVAASLFIKAGISVATEFTYESELSAL